MKSPFCCDIAGLYYRHKGLKSGSFFGYVKPEDNEHDPNAIAVYLESGQKIGYIPRQLTYLVRYWEPSFECLKCEIYLDIYEPYERYDGTVLIYPIKDNISDQLKGKKIYVGKDFSFYSQKEVKILAESFGAIINDQLKLDTDYVIYEEIIPTTAQKKFNTSSYKFQPITLYDFIKIGLSDTTADLRFKGKNIFLNKRVSNLYYTFLYRYLIENGAVLKNSITKETDIYIKWGDHTTASIEKAQKNGVEIISSDDIFPMKTESTYVSTNNTYVTPNIKNNKNKNNNSGCAGSLILIITFISFILTLL